MIEEPAMTTDQIRAKGIELLTKKLGPVGMARFLQQTENGWGDYTRDRKAWLGDPDVRSLAARIKAGNQEKS